jgi:FtsX-like permease family
VIGLVLSMINARRAQAVTLFLLATVAVASAVAGPVAMRAVDAAVVRLEVANATDRERGISLLAFSDPTETFNQADSLTGFVSLPGFKLIRGGEHSIFGPVADPARLSTRPGTRLVFRDGVCGHVSVVEGRCLVGGREIIIGTQTAQRTGLGPGDLATVQSLTYSPDGVPIPDGAPAALTVVGVFEPGDVDEPYWGGQAYFPISTDGTRDEAVFITPGAMALVEHTGGISYLDALAEPGALTGERLDGLPEEIESLLTGIDELPNITVATDLPALAERVANSRELARQLGPVAFIPLAGISFFVIYLAVGYGVFGRRGELGLVALRGISARRRWVLATGETVVAILVGAPVGYVLGHLGVGLLASLRLGSAEGTELSTESLPYAAAALVIAVAVALLGQRRALAEPVVELLRGVPRARGVWQAVAVEALLGALAVVATLQLRSGTDISGLGLLVPGLVVVAVALLAARANVAVTGSAARFALRRGFIGAGLSAVQLARRPGSQRLFALLAVGTAMLAFVAAGVDVANRAREDRATVQTGAPRVLLVDGADARRLLGATEAVDPAGEWAMAAAVIPSTQRAVPTVLAVDTSRLAAVATWRSEFGADAAGVAEALSPPAAEPLELHGTEVEVEVEVKPDLMANDPNTPGFRHPIELDLDFVTLDGKRVVAVADDLALGENTVIARAAGCDQGCRLVGLTVPDLPGDIFVGLRGVRQLDPPADVVGPADLAEPSRWRASSNAVVIPGAAALSVRSGGRLLGDRSVRVGVADARMPVPIATVGQSTASRITSLDKIDVNSEAVLNLAMIPRLGSVGALVDLRYLERTLVGLPNRDRAEIWLGPQAPADAVDQLRALGLAVVGEVSVEEQRSILSRQGPALALHFHLAAAVLCVLLAVGGLGLVAAVDRRQRAADLRALRVQGLPRRMVRRAALWGYLSTVVLAGLTGLAAAAVAWIVAGDRIPIFIDTGSGLAPPRWPLWASVVQPWAAAVVVMMVAAVASAWALRRAVRSGGNGGAR